MAAKNTWSFVSQVLLNWCIAAVLWCIFFIFEIMTAMVQYFFFSLCICSYLAFWSTRFSFFFPRLTWDRVANWHRLSPNDCSAQGKGNSFLPTCWIVGVYNQHFSAFYDDALPLLMLNFLLDAISGIQKSSTAPQCVCILSVLIKRECTLF